MNKDSGSVLIEICTKIVIDIPHHSQYMDALLSTLDSVAHHSSTVRLALTAYEDEKRQCAQMVTGKRGLVSPLNFSCWEGWRAYDC